MHCWILLCAIFFHVQSQLDEASFCRVGRVILSSGIVGMDVGDLFVVVFFRARLCLFAIFGFEIFSDYFVGQTLSIR